MSRLTATASCTAYTAVVEATGEVVAQALLVRRVAWLTALARDVTARLVVARWNRADLDALGSGVGLDGRVLPSKGWMAVRRLGWGVGPEPGVYVCDRVLRCAQEQAARLLRLALHRRRLVAAIVATWPQNTGARTGAEWQALRALLPDGVSAADIRNRTRQIRAYLDEHHTFPTDLTELEEPPNVAAQVVLAAADRQLLTLERIGHRGARLRVRLPLVESPASARDWAWHVLPVVLPPTVPSEARLCAPTLRVTKGRVRVDLPFQIPIGFVPATGHVIGCGFDWGVNGLLTGVVGRLVADGRVISGSRVIGDGRPLLYDASGDRDWAAAERIVSRGLLGQHATRTHRSTGVRTIHAVVERNVVRARRTRRLTRAARRARRTRTDLHPRPAARDRAKRRPTPKRPTSTSVNPRNKTSSRVPDRRTVPAPPPARGGQRPAGHAPKPGRHQPYRTGHVRNSHHRTGFHHAKATPVLMLAKHRGGPGQATPARVT
ncbi:hypothetical protein [Nonomuraea sp. NPDC049750]|uniref:hypothetical protein n=1 Tax=Nonomuraea sp. NPDC049750 TaxID=3154738 RepID=UPI003404BFC1